ncbi:MAG: DUF1127 domain-containing protein [Pseudomonadota bacterium]
MATFETIRTQPVGVRAGGFFSTLIARLVDWNDRRITRNSLSALTARELNDIGLSRGDIANF